MHGGAAQRARCASSALALLMSCAAGSRCADAEEFFPTRDENPLLRAFYLPLPSDARADAGPSFGATLNVSNTLNVERNSHESLFVDGESATLRMTFEDGVGSAWRYRFTVPVTRDSDGVLDTTIDTYHRTFGFRRGYRPYYPKNRLLYLYSGMGRIDLAHSQTSVGDIAADAGWYAVDDARHTVSLWGGVEAPTGRRADLTSDGAWDVAAWGHAAWRGERWQGAGEVGVAQPLGDEIFAGAAHRTSAFARMAVTRRMGSAWSLRAQLDGQTARVTGSDLRFLGPSLQLTVGAVRRLGDHWQVQFGFVEDAAVNTAPDITFFLGIHT